MTKRLREIVFDVIQKLDRSSVVENLPAAMLKEHGLIDRAQAFSTLLHETVHWWQHVGSTYGLMLSLTYPTQLHGNYNH